MKCYFCSAQGGPGGTTYGIRDAVAVCTDCGAGVCVRHLAVAPAGEPLRCQIHQEKKAQARNGDWAVPAGV